jgi:hypothetical protein
LTWNGSETRFDWGDPASPADAHTFRVPGRLRGDAPQSSFLLLVEKGSARFDGLVLEES